jgi:hypothetical protein
VWPPRTHAGSRRLAAIEHPSPVNLTRPASTVRDVAARESVCCSFFDFTVCVDADRVLLDVRVPPARAEVLDGMTALASAGGRCERERRAH